MKLRYSDLKILSKHHINTVFIKKLIYFNFLFKTNMNRIYIFYYIYWVFKVYFLNYTSLEYTFLKFYRIVLSLIQILKYFYNNNVLFYLMDSKNNHIKQKTLIKYLKNLKISYIFLFSDSKQKINNLNFKNLIIINKFFFFL